MKTWIFFDILDQVVSETQIISWTDNKIEFQIPPLAPGTLSEPVSLEVCSQTATWDLPVTIYDLTTQAKVTETNNQVRVLNTPSTQAIEIHFSSGEKIESQDPNLTLIPGDQTVISIRLLDRNGQGLPFFVDPDEFGF